MPQLHRHVVPSEALDELVERTPCSLGPFGEERLRDRPFPTSGEHQPVPRMRCRQLLERECRCTLACTKEMRLGDRAAESAIPLWTSSEDDQMRSLWIGDAVLTASQPQSQFGSEHRRDPTRASCLGEANGTVEPVVVG